MHDVSRLDICRNAENIAALDIDYKEGRTDKVGLTVRYSGHKLVEAQQGSCKSHLRGFPGETDIRPYPKGNVAPTLKRGTDPERALPVARNLTSFGRPPSEGTHPGTTHLDSSKGSGTARDSAKVVHVQRRSFRRRPRPLAQRDSTILHANGH